MITRVLKFIMLVSILSLGACATTQNLTSSNNHKYKVRKTFRARVTFYSNATCPYGSKVASPYVKKAKEGETIAAAKKYDFGAFGTKVEIPALVGVAGDNIFEVQDRGSAVEGEKASHHTAPVFDVFVYAASRKEGKQKEKLLASLNPDYIEVNILDPTDNKLQFAVF